MRKIVILFLVTAMNLTFLYPTADAASIESEVGIVKETVMIQSDCSDIKENFQYFSDNLSGDPLPQLDVDTATITVRSQPIYNGDTTLVANAILKREGNTDIRLNAGGDHTYVTYLQIDSEEIAGNDTPKIKLWSEGRASAAKGVSGLYIKIANGLTSGIYSFEADVYAPQPYTLRYIISRCPEFSNTWQMFDETGGYVLPQAMTGWKKLRVDLNVDKQQVITYLDNEVQGQPAFYQSKEPGYPPTYFGIMSINNGIIYIDNIKLTKIDGSVQLSLNKSNLMEVKNSESDSMISIIGMNASGSPFDIYTIVAAYDDKEQLIGICQAKKSILSDGTINESDIPLSGINGISYVGSNNIHNVATLKVFASHSLDYLYPNIYALTVKDDTNFPVFYDINNHNDKSHEWYTGSAFTPISSWAQNQTNKFAYIAPEAGEYEIRVRYANGHADAKTLSLYVNGIDQKQLSFVPTNDPTNGKQAWNTWSDLIETVTLVKGANTIYLKQDDGQDTGDFNVDAICIKPVTSEN